MDSDGQRVTEALSMEDAQSGGGSMRAIVQDAYGSADVLRLASIPKPEPKANEVLIRVHAAGMDSGTWHLTTGKPYLLRLVFGLRKPTNPVPGLDVSGTVVAVGSAVTRFRPGDEVFGFGRGSYAQYTVALEDKLALKPGNLSFEQAAVVPVSASTALQGLRAGGITAGARAGVARAGRPPRGVRPAAGAFRGRGVRAAPRGPAGPVPASTLVR